MNHKSESIASEIREAIKAGIFPIGSKMPSERTLAGHFNSTQLTINKTLSMLSAEGLLEKRHGSGNYVTRLPQGKRICFLTEEIGRHINPVWYSIYERCHLSAREMGFEVNLFIVPAGSDEIAPAVCPPSDAAIAGISLTHGRVKSLLARNIPLVWLDDYEFPLEGPAVHFDNFEAGRLAAKHLAGEGCKRLLYMTHTMAKPPSGYGDFPSDRRFEGFKQGALEHGLEEDSVSRYSCMGDFSNFVPELSPLLKKSKGVDGMLCYSDNILSYALQAAAVARRSIPGDLAVMGIDGSPLCELIQPGFTTLRQPTEKMAAKAMSLLASYFDTGAFPQERTAFPPELMTRDSTRLGLKQ